MATQQTIKNQVATRTLRPMSPAVAEVRTNINLMVEVMKSCMVKDMHFGVIPGVQKPSLFKAGAEKLMATFKLSANPVVEDLSKDGEIRFRVKVEINAKDGSFVGAGIGECSSQEEKYMWRAAVCQEEFDITEETKRRIKFKKAWENNKQVIEKVIQVRCNPSDLANTILKMAKKRALVDGVLTATGASDLFSQDIEDLPAEYVDTIAKVAPKSEVVSQTTTPKPQNGAKPAQEATKDLTDEEVAAQWNGEVVTHSIADLGVGDEMSEFEGLVNSIETKSVKKKNGEMTVVSEYSVEDPSGVEFVVSKWGSAKEGSKGAICTFLCVKRGEDFKGVKKFMASDIVVKQ